jgi:hypothetical protein
VQEFENSRYPAGFHPARHRQPRAQRLSGWFYVVELLKLPSELLRSCTLALLHSLNFCLHTTLN